MAAMAFKDDLAALEQSLTDAQVSVGDVLAGAGVVRSTWTRWKKGTFGPRLQVWDAVKASADRLISEKQDGA